MTKQIDIKELIPFMKDGWVAMDECKEWYWYKEKPQCMLTGWWSDSFGANLYAFNLTPVEDWTKSLIKLENKDGSFNT